MDPLMPQWLTSKVKMVSERDEGFEVLLFSSPQRYRLDKKELFIHDALLEAKQQNREIKLLINPELGMVLDWEQNGAP